MSKWVSSRKPENDVLPTIHMSWFWRTFCSVFIWTRYSEKTLYSTLNSIWFPNSPRVWSNGFSRFTEKNTFAVGQWIFDYNSVSYGCNVQSTRPQHSWHICRKKPSLLFRTEFFMNKNFAGKYIDFLWSVNFFIDTLKESAAVCPSVCITVSMLFSSKLRKTAFVWRLEILSTAKEHSF